jgi:hypothetical protein
MITLLLVLTFVGSLNFYPATIILSLPLGAEMIRRKYYCLRCKFTKFVMIAPLTKDVRVC